LAWVVEKQNAGWAEEAVAFQQGFVFGGVGGHVGLQEQGVGHSTFQFRDRRRIIALSPAPLRNMSNIFCFD
jgi:hypothetical protein